MAGANEAAAPAASEESTSSAVSSVTTIEDQIRELGAALLSPPSDSAHLFALLEEIERVLARVDQSPSELMSVALHPVMRALIAEDLLESPDTDIRVAVASCISEITRITAPEVPYDDHLMKEVFSRIVEVFKELDVVESRLYLKRLSVLETVAKVRSCVVMLDLQCNDLILEMFGHFLRTINSYHPERVFDAMESIMTRVVEESDEVYLPICSCLLNSVRKDKKDLFPNTYRLAEKVVRNCTAKLKSAFEGSIHSNSASVEDFSMLIIDMFRNDDVAKCKETKSDNMVVKNCEEHIGCFKELELAAAELPCAEKSGVEMKLVGPVSGKSLRRKNRRKGFGRASEVAKVGAMALVSCSKDETSGDLLASTPPSQPGKLEQHVEDVTKCELKDCLVPRPRGYIRKASSDKAPKSAPHELRERPRRTNVSDNLVVAGKEFTRKRKFQVMDSNGGDAADKNVPKPRDLGTDLVGRKIKVWWPDDKKFYGGTVESFNRISKKHKVLYDDGDVEMLLLRNERWKFSGGKYKKENGRKVTSVSERSEEDRRRTESRKERESRRHPEKSAEKDVSSLSSSSRGAHRLRTRRCEVNESGSTRKREKHAVGGARKQTDTPAGGKTRKLAGRKRRTSTQR